MANYYPNMRHWCKGDVVIHDSDAKEPRMLMVVIGYTRDGLCKTQYVDTRHRRTIWKNELQSLHDPQQFKLNPEWGHHRQDLIQQYQDDWERVRRWNYHYKVGQRVRTTSADGGFETITTHIAIMRNNGQAEIYLQRGGCWLLRFVEAVAA